jgi:hypothetical protein
LIDDLTEKKNESKAGIKNNSSKKRIERKRYGGKQVINCVKNELKTSGNK